MSKTKSVQMSVRVTPELAAAVEERAAELSEATGIDVKPADVIRLAMTDAVMPPKAEPPAPPKKRKAKAKRKATRQ